MAKRTRTTNDTAAIVGYEAQLWQMADAMASIERDNPALKSSAFWHRDHCN
jgi:uncharacterized protein